MWDEALVPWLRRQWSRRRYRRHILAGRLGFLRRRGLVLLCRLGLMAGFLVWSGWSQCWPLSWALLSLPLADAILSLLLKVRVYPYLVRGVHDLYLLALMGLFSEELLHLRDSPWSLLVGGCVRVADGTSARGEIDEDGTWRLELDGYESGLLRTHSGRFP